MRLKPLLIVLAALGLSSPTTGRATSRPGVNTRVQTVRAFYSALIDEVAHAGYSASERSLIEHPIDYYGRYLDERSRDYVDKTVMPRIADAIAYFELDKQPRQRVLDLGCGLGMQSLIFASLGASVVGIDVRKESIDLCWKRKRYYEDTLGFPLDLHFHHGDFALIGPETFGSRFDALFSMSAFSYVKPFERAVGRASALLQDQSRIFLYEQNAGFALDGLKRSEPIPTPQEIAAAFGREGFVAELLEGAGAIPWSLWRVPALNESVLAPANEMLRKTLRLSFKYVLAMRRSGL